MSYDQYLLTTLMKGAGKIVPIVVTIVIGYFVFIKLPFLFFRRTLRDVRREQELTNEGLPKFPEEPKIMKLEEKIKRDAEELKKEKQKREQQSQKEGPKTKKEDPTESERRKEKKKEEPKKEPPKKPAAEAGPTPENVFELRPGEKFTQDELKAKYRELLKQNHPDKVAMMGPDFQRLAEKKTKEINEAYEKLKKKAS